MRRLVFSTLLLPGMRAHFGRSLIGQGPAPLHTHDFHEFFWIESGRGIMTTASLPVSLAPGMLCLVHADDQHGFSGAPSEHLRMANLAISKADWADLMKRYRPGNDPLRWPAHQRRRLLNADELGALRFAAYDLDHGLRDRLASERLLLTVLSLLRETPQTTTMPAWLSDGLRALEQGRWRAGTSALVSASGRSREHVARVCRDLLNTTPTALVTDARLRHVARRLVESNDLIGTIAAETGLTNLAHLYRLFRRTYGMSPGAWRQRHHDVIRPGE